MMKKIIILLLLTAFSQIGCSGKQHLESFNRANIDIGYVKTIAVLPFANNSQDEFAPERVRNITITQILADELFDIVDKGVVDSHLRDEAIQPDQPLNKQDLNRIGQRLNVQAVLLGTIDIAKDERRGAVSFPELSVTLRLLEVESGLIIWQASGNENGDSTWRRLFGIEAINSFEVSLNLINTMLDTIPR